MPALSAVEEKGQTFMSTMMPSTHFRVSERTIESSISSLLPSALLLLSAAMLAYGSYTPSGTSSPLGLLLLLFDERTEQKHRARRTNRLVVVWHRRRMPAGHHERLADVLANVGAARNVLQQRGKELRVARSLGPVGQSDDPLTAHRAVLVGKTPRYRPKVAQHRREVGGR